MKKFFLPLVLAAVCLFSSCKYDDSELWSEIDDLQSQIDAIKKQCEKFNADITALQQIAVAVQGYDYVTKVTTNADGSYTLTFAQTGNVTITNGKDGVDGTNGTNGTSPVIGIKEVDGVLYWTINGELLKDADGNFVKAVGQDGQPGQDGMTPTVGIDAEGYWTVTIGDQTSRITDAEGNPIVAKGDKGETGDSFFKSVTDADDNVVIVLADGTTFTLPKANDKPEIVVLNGNKISISSIKTNSEDELTFDISTSNISDMVLLKVEGTWKADLTGNKLVVKPTAPVLEADKAGSIVILGVGAGNTAVIKRIAYKYTNVLRYAGEVYEIALMADGRWWMAENLRYLPEGVVASDDPTADAAVWYPSNSKKVADAAMIEQSGYYYSLATALGVAEVTEADQASYAGKQGVCPEGWYIPTADDFKELIINEKYHNPSSKGSATNYQAGSAFKKLLEPDGMVFGTTGMRQKNTPTTNGVYAYAENSGFWWTSTPKSFSEKSSYFYDVMGMKAAESDGYIQIAQQSIYAGTVVRCIKAAK